MYIRNSKLQLMRVKYITWGFKYHLLMYLQSSIDDFRDIDENGDPLAHNGNYGFYFIAGQKLIPENEKRRFSLPRNYSNKRE